MGAAWFLLYRRAKRDQSGAGVLPMSGAYDGSVGAAVLGHEEAAGGKFRVEQVGGAFLVDVDAQAGRIVGIEMAPLQHGMAGEDRVLFGAEVVFFLDAKVVADHVE